MNNPMDSNIHFQIKPALKNKQLQKNLPLALKHAQKHRDKAVQEETNWEELRDHASQVKQHSLSRLDHYLVQLEQSLQRVGGKVVWANDSAEAIDFILRLLHERGVNRVVKK